MECHGYNINPNHQCTMDHLSIIWAHFELQMILCMVKCQITHSAVLTLRLDVEDHFVGVGLYILWGFHIWAAFNTPCIWKLKY